jgi:hypothetical protein
MKSLESKRTTTIDGITLVQEKYKNGSVTVSYVVNENGTKVSVDSKLLTTNNPCPDEEDFRLMLTTRVNYFFHLPVAAADKKFQKKAIEWFALKA